jgi:cell division protein FtsB
MEYIGLLAPIAFIFSIAAYSQVSSLKKEVEALKAEVERLKNKQ